MPIESWESFFLGEVGAAAALGGLLFVAISINLTKILENGGLADRALEALLLILAILIVASLMLLPAQGPLAIGIEILAVGGVLLILGTALAFRALGQSEAAYRRTFVANILAFEAVVVPYLIGGVLVLSGSASGFYWLAAAILLGFVKAVSDAWIFLVEINR